MSSKDDVGGVYLLKVRLRDGIWDLCLALQLFVGPPSSLIRTVDVVVVVRLSLLASSLGQTDADADVGWTLFSAPTRRRRAVHATENGMSYKFHPRAKPDSDGVWEMGVECLSHLIRQTSDTNADSGFVEHLFEYRPKN